MKKKLLTCLFLFSFLVIDVVKAEPEMPPGGGAPQGGMSGETASHVGNIEITEDGEYAEETFECETGDENAILISGATVSFTDVEVTKSGNSDGENADFYGTNAAIFAYEGANVTITGGSVTTNGSHANAIFSYDSGKITVSDTKVRTTSNNSGGIMVTGGGTLVANNLDIETDGNSSAAIRSDRGGGTMTVTGGTYKTNGMGSPVIYSTADITVNKANLISTSSEGVVVEGFNSVKLNSCKLTDTNHTLNGNSTTYKNIFLYQSMSGDAEEGLASFEAKNSTIITNQGDTFYVTNTTAEITLENNTFTNESGDFLRIEAAKWGNTGSNGGEVTLALKNQKINGNIVVDSISKLTMAMKEGSVFEGAINTARTAKNVSLTLTSDSTFILTDDCYLNSLQNTDSSNKNIYSNGHHLYVDGNEVETNKGTPGEEEEVQPEKTEKKLSLVKIGAVVLGIILVCSTVLVVIIKRKNKKDGKVF